MNGPPKEKGAPAKSAPRTELPIAYYLSPVSQAARLKDINGAVEREREAARLFLEFWRTPNQKRLRAFFTHVLAMRLMRGGIQ